MVENGTEFGMGSIQLTEISYNVGRLREMVRHDE